MPTSYKGSRPSKPSLKSICIQWACLLQALPVTGCCLILQLWQVIKCRFGMGNLKSMRSQDICCCNSFYLHRTIGKQTQINIPQDTVGSLIHKQGAWSRWCNWESQVWRMFISFCGHYKAAVTKQL